MKRILSVVLSVISILTLAVSAFADDVTAEPIPEYRISERDTVASDPCSEAPAEPQTPAAPSEQGYAETGEYTADETSYNTPDAVSEDDSLISDATVAVMYLCASAPHLPYYWFGHAWICVKNVSDKDIKVGSRALAPGEMISMGLHHDGGLHYNYEMSRFKGKKVSALETPLTSAKLSLVNSELNNSEWSRYGLFTHNCTNFATSVWYRATGRRFFAFCFPFVVQLQMPISETTHIIMSSR